ncbi:MAG: FAD/NAD(P)-binding oxidoreductase [Pseudomonadota bacterium]
MEKVVVVGGGQAGASCVAKLRELGFEGAITLLGREPAPPYQRPPLSKKYLLGEMELDRMYLRPVSYYAEQRIELVLGDPVVEIDAPGQRVRHGSQWMDYDALVLATGSEPRRLPAAIGGDLGGVHVVRTLYDVDHMAPEFVPGRRALIVGGGYIGLEAAAVAAAKGLQVTLVEMAERILQRVASAETASFFRDLHTGHGVEIVEGVGLSALTAGKDGRVAGAVLSDGREIEIDFAIVGVGIDPDTALAEAAGCTIDNGIATDTQGRTSVPGIWAAGDCASFPYRDGRVRLESVPNAIDQAEVVAENILGAGKDYAAKPWFWSDQFDVKLQIAGLSTGYDRVVTRPGAKGGTSFWYFRGAELLAVDAANEPRAYMIGKRMIEAGNSPAPEALADPAVDLKSLMR